MKRPDSYGKTITYRPTYCLLPFGVSILLSSVFGRKFQLFIIQFIPTHWIAPAIFLLLFCLLILLFLKREKMATSPFMLVFALLLICTGALLIYFKLLVPIEAVHFLLFSSFGYVASVTFGRTKGFFIVLFVATGDEILQHFLPDRIGDFHDVIINSVSGCMGLVLGGRK